MVERTCTPPQELSPALPPLPDCSQRLGPPRGPIGDSEAGPGIHFSAVISTGAIIPPTSRHRFLPAPLLSPESFASFQFDAKILMSLKEEITC